MRCGTRKRGGRARPLALAVAALLVGATGARALPLDVTLTVVPPTPGTLVPGSSLFVEVAVSGLTAGDAPSLMSIDLDIGFDDGQLDWVETVFIPFPVGTETTNAMGDPCTSENLDGNCDVVLSSELLGPGVLDLAAASLVAPEDVNASQPAAGAIATIEFLVQTAGGSVLDFDEVLASGTTSGTTQDSFATTSSGTSISVAPEPGTALLLGLGLLGVAGGRRRA